MTLSSLTEEQQTVLNRPITKDEVLDAMGTPKSRKAPELDGYPVGL